MDFILKYSKTPIMTVFFSKFLAKRGHFITNFREPFMERDPIESLSLTCSHFCNSADGVAMTLHARARVECGAEN